jgi:hypothetical protein
MMLAIENRQNLDNRTLGEIFYLLTDELAVVTWIQAFQMLMQCERQVVFYSFRRINFYT